MRKVHARMTRRIALLGAIVAMLAFPLAAAFDVAAQETAPDCASAFWLDAASEAAGAESARVEDAAAPSWLSAELTDACSGQAFSLADFSGKVMYVEAMATWCPPCRDQLGRVRDAMAQLPEEERAETVVVALSSEVDLPREVLAQYAADNDFPFVFAVMPAEVLQAMVDDLGQEVAVAPATPHLVIAADGTIGELHTGSAPPEDILALLAAARATQP